MNALDDGIWPADVGLAMDRNGQLAYTFEPSVPTSKDTVTSASGRMTLHHEWRDSERTYLRRLVLEGCWANGPFFYAEARRPAGGWRGDELARLLLAVLTFGCST